MATPNLPTRRTQQTDTRFMNPRTPPSPTLTNPDMVLPSALSRFPMPPSPARTIKKEEPPSPSYLVDPPNGSATHVRSPSGTSMDLPAKREKRGLMSRKMMLLRSRTASTGIVKEVVLPSSPERDPAFRSSPTIVHMGSFAPVERVASLSSTGTVTTDSEGEDIVARPQFLARYEPDDASGTDDELEGSPTETRNGYAASDFTSNLEAHRRQNEEDEQHSAILSQRAEQILANAKKRLNLMEGNLRGARDLVAPLTAANLRRATSAASYHPRATAYTGGNQYAHNNYHQNRPTQADLALNPQASSPSLTRDFQGHWRGFSDERPYTSTSLNHTDTSPIIAQGFIPTKAHDPQWTKTLKGSRSHDSLGVLAHRRAGSREGFYGLGSAEVNLAPLVEDDGGEYLDGGYARDGYGGFDGGVGSSQRAKSPEDLHEQMNSLKGRISALKERAKEDSLRRQSMQNLRDPSPLNNAVGTAPELFHTSIAARSASAGGQRDDREVAPRPKTSDRMQSYETIWEPTPVSTPLLSGSRNAFAEEARRLTQKPSENSLVVIGRSNGPSQTLQPAISHRRTPSGSLIVQPSKHRYSHHALYHVHDLEAGHTPNDTSLASNSRNSPNSNPPDQDESSQFGDDETSQPDTSISLHDPAFPLNQIQAPAMVIAHEDRDDAFDYEHFFLHSAMAYYSERRPSASSSNDEDGDSDASSVSTARGPRTLLKAEAFDGDDRFYSSSSSSDGEDLDEGEVEGDVENFPPGTPETPEKLREIEDRLLRRSLSESSLTSMLSFATATEGPSRVESAEISMAQPVHVNRTWPVREGVVHVDATSARARTAVVGKKVESERRGSGGEHEDERADSGVSLVDGGRKEAPKPIEVASNGPEHGVTSNGSGSTGSLSPTPEVSKDPAATIVNTLLMPTGRKLGLRDKALVFSLVEGLRTACLELQAGEEGSLESRALRRRLEDARKVLCGGSDGSPRIT